MHAGFAMLCAGAIRSKNTMNILLMTILDACVAGFAFYLVGWAFAYGGYGGYQESATRANGFIGTSMFALSDFQTEWGGNTYEIPVPDENGDIAGAMDRPCQTNEPPCVTSSVHWQDWFFQWAFAATATTIPAGCVAERFNFNAYLGYTWFISAWVYPVVVHWVWSSPGWLGYWRDDTFGTPLLNCGFIDFAGSAVVHMVGGFSGMWGAILVGPRMGRFDSNGDPVDMPGHSATLVVLGTCFLWFGWYGFNPGSVLVVTSIESATVMGRAAVCTTLSGAAGGLTGLMLGFFKAKAWDLLTVTNNVLVGFVSITAGAHVLEPWAAIIAGFVGACIFEGTCWLFLKLKIDDPLCAAPMHGVVGVWACLWTGCVARQEYVLQAYGYERGYGAFYPGGYGWLLACQIIGVLVIFGWIAANMVPFFYILKMFNLLRISAEDEQAGLDVSKHGGSAYNVEDKKGKQEATGL
mmetsp:Transcript_9779/g.21800  ORF Transcript_9779/g.21800 Transcript_9779/m.21800 type:complete len:465 (-) Transcript_9779:305-1699(-)